MHEGYYAGHPCLYGMTSCEYSLGIITNTCFEAIVHAGVTNTTYYPHIEAISSLLITAWT